VNAASILKNKKIKVGEEKEEGDGRNSTLRNMGELISAE
jgi:hypothetical protein